MTAACEARRARVVLRDGKIVEGLWNPETELFAYRAYDRNRPYAKVVGPDGYCTNVDLLDDEPIAA